MGTEYYVEVFTFEEQEIDFELTDNFEDACIAFDVLVTRNPTLSVRFVNLTTGYLIDQHNWVER